MADPIERAAQVVRRVEGATSPGFHQASRAAFLSAIEAPRPQRLRWAVGLALAVAVSAAVFALFGTPLTYAVEGGSAAHDVASVLRFSDGTVLELDAGGQAEVVSTDARGAVVRVSSGVLNARVLHRWASRWAVQAGPYTVHVTGTRFSAGRSGADQIDVELFEGSVEISGPGLAAPLPLKAGQHFRATLEKTGPHIEVGNSSEPRTAKPAPVARPPTTAPQGPPRAVRPPIVPAKVPAEPPAQPDRVTWREQVAAGAFVEVLAAARAEGLEHALQRDLDDVFALGEAARYLKEDALAKRCFLAVRSRSPKSADAAQSALLLGRLAERQAQWAEADEWYERCELDGLTSLIPEALGRRMIVLEHLGQREQARAVARRYLELDPSGPWAAIARRTLE